METEGETTRKEIVEVFRIYLVIMIERKKKNGKAILFFILTGFISSLF